MRAKLATIRRNVRQFQARHGGDAGDLRRRTTPVDPPARTTPAIPVRDGGDASISASP